MSLVDDETDLFKYWRNKSTLKKDLIQRLCVFLVLCGCMKMMILSTHSLAISRTMDFCDILHRQEKKNYTDKIKMAT